MYLDHRMLAKISQIISSLSMKVMLLDYSGQVMLPEDNNKVFTLPEALLKDPNTPLVYGGFTLIGTGSEQPLFICMEGDSGEVKSCCLLCAELINSLTKAEAGQITPEQNMRLILRGEVEPAEISAISNEHQIPLNLDRCVFYFHFSELSSETAMNILKNVVNESEGDIVCEVGRHAVALVKAFEESLDYSDMEQLAEAIQNTFISETGYSALIGVGEIHSELSKLNESYNEAKNAINIGRSFHPKQNIFIYRRMMLERFLSSIPDETGLAFHQLMFNRKNARLFNDEILETIEKFFDNSLNLSETARQLYIHRNTLVYRLDKIQRSIGLDLRAFDDAVTFKLMMLLGKNKTEKKSKI